MKNLLLLLIIFGAIGCVEKPLPESAPAGEETSIAAVETVASASLPVPDYPPSENPYWIEPYDLWLVHTLEGELLAFSPFSPEYSDDINVPECRYTWNPPVRRFVDPCSGDEWELDGKLNLENSPELWSNRALDRYPVSIQGDLIIIRPDQPITGPPISLPADEIAVTNTPVDQALPEPEPTVTPEPTPTAAAIIYPPYDCPVEPAATVPNSSTDEVDVFYLGSQGIYHWQEISGRNDLIVPAGNIIGLQMSDDGQFVAYLQMDDAAAGSISLRVFDADGETNRLLLSEAEFRGFHNESDAVVVRPWLITFVPNSHTLALSTIRYDLVDGNIEGITAHRYDDLMLIDVNSGEVTHLLSPGAGGDFYYSPDGQQIALVNDSSLSLMNSDGSNLRQNVITWQPLGITHDYYRPEPAWLPDSQSLLIAAANAEDNIDAFYNPDASSTIFRVPVDGEPESITTMVGAPLGPSFSPDGRRVAFDRVGNENLPYALHIAAVDNAWNVVYATGQGLNFNGWLPDSSGFVFRALRDAPQLGRLCQEPNPLPLPEMADSADSFVRWIEWIDDSRFLFTIDEPPQLLMGDLNGEFEPIGALRPEYYFGTGSFQAFDFTITEPTTETWETYTSAEYGFSIQYPPGWTPVDTLPNQISLVRKGTGIALRFLVREVEEEVNLVRSGVPAGDLYPREAVMFLGQLVSSELLTYQGRNKAVLYAAADEITRENLVFVISLESNSGEYEDINIAQEFIDEAEAILSSAKWLAIVRY